MRRRNVLVLTKAYEWLVPPFLYLYGQYWGEPLLISSDQELSMPLPDYCAWLRVPAYSQGVWPWQFWWGNGLRSILAEVDEPAVSLFLPDYWITCPVQVEKVEVLAEYMVCQGNVLRIGLQAGTCLDTYGRFRESYAGLDIVAVTPGCVHCGTQAGASLGVALWDKDKLSRLVEPHWSPWALEKLGSEKMWWAHKDWVSVGVRPGLARKLNALSQNQPKVVDLRGLTSEDAERIREWLPAGYRVLN